MDRQESSGMVQLLGAVLGDLKDAIRQQNFEVEPLISGVYIFVSYCYSRYGAACIAMALILNRTLILGSTNTSRMQQMNVHRRRNYEFRGSPGEMLKLVSHILFRGSAIYALLYSAHKILVTLNLTAILTGRPDNWFFSHLRASGCFNYNVDTADPYLRTPDKQVMWGPSTDLYWPVFLSYCVLIYIETFLSVVDGQRPYADTGLTIFENSMNFHIAGFTGAFISDDNDPVKRPTEQALMMCLFQILTHLNVQIGALVNKNRTRLIPSTLIGLGSIAYFVSLVMNKGIIDFPLLTAMFMIPQVVTLAIIGMSLVVFVMAVFATGFNYQDLNFSRFFYGKDDPEFSSHQIIKLNEDFFTVLWNLAIFAVTLAGKSSYISELSILTVDDETWVERNIWQKFKHNFEALREINSLKGEDVVKYINDSKEPRGYGNLIVDPKSRIFGDQADVETGYVQLGKTSIIKKRVTYLYVIIKFFSQLLKGLTIDQVVGWFRNLPLHDITFNELGEESYEHLEERKSRVPPFLRRFVKPKTVDIVRPITAKIVELDDFSEEELSNQYVTLFRNREISEVDNSIDYAEFSEVDESDVESINDNNDVLAPEIFEDIFEDDDNVQIFKHHMHNESGILTRSKYSKLTHLDLHKDETTKLIEVILSKRHGHLQELFSSPNVTLNQASDDLDLDSSKFDCVICQVNTREIVTWPCKCYAICEGCRITLASKGIEGCVCCRKKVEGVSKIYIP